MLKTNKNVVNVLANLSTTMCHTFIQDKKLIISLLNLTSDSSYDKHFEDAIDIVED
jgi:hypothetical protein